MRLYYLWRIQAAIRLHDARADTTTQVPDGAAKPFSHLVYGDIDHTG